MANTQHEHDDSEDDEDLTLLAGGRRVIRPRHISDGIVIPLGQLLAICLAAMAIGASIPMVFSSNDNNTVTALTTKIQAPTVFDGDVDIDNQEKNNLRHSVRVDDDNDEEPPKIAWLMSFPNSGTSYTINLVQAVSNLSMASNYGWEHLGRGNVSYPVRKGGPYWLAPNAAKPQNLVLTKTHCGGYCHGCHVRKSVETPHSFLMHCAKADGALRVDNVTKTVHHVYDYNNDVDRAVHLIRDPLDNMVSRYHLGLHKVEKSGDQAKLQRYTYDAQGFTNFCGDIRYESEEHSDSHVDQHALRLIEDVPCHMDLFRYVQWHNLAFITTQDLLKVPVHIVHYEEYTDHFQETLGGLLEFLDLPNTGAVTEFETGKSYRDYFTATQIAAMRNATRILASPMTWERLERYF